MAIRSSFLFSLIIAAAVAGCAALVPPNYAFSYPDVHKEEWTQTYPANRDESSTKCVLTNDETGAQMRFIEDATQAPTPRDAALAYRHILRNREVEVDDEVKVSEDGFASFTTNYPRKGLKGKVVVTPRTSSGRCVVIIAVWPAARDAHARADTDAVIRDLSISVTP